MNKFNYSGFIHSLFTFGCFVLKFYGEPVKEVKNYTYFRMNKLQILVSFFSL